MSINLLNLSSLFFKFASENYEKFREMVERKSEKNPYPFESWFDENGRTYIEFKASRLEPDEDVEDFLLNHNYIIVDYMKGLVKDINGRVLKIGKALNKIEKELIETKRKELDISYSEEEIKHFEDNIKKEINEIRTIFEQSPVRSGSKQNLNIVFSQNPHDVAKMSTDRHWESCMTLGTGGEYKNVFCEVAGGGFIAYLIKENDKDIKAPTARIHIRRFDNADGNSIALAEETVYGNDVPGFLEAVKIWVDNKNKVSPGLYEMKGGEYSDTYSGNVVQLPENEQKIMDWLKGENLPSNVIYKEWSVVDNYSDELESIYGYYEDYENDDEDIFNRDATFRTKEEAEHYLQMLNWDERVENENEQLIRDLGLVQHTDWGTPVDDEEYDKVYDKFTKDRFSINEDYINLQPTLNKKIIDQISEKKMNFSDEFLNRFKDVVFKEGTYIDIANFITNYTKYITKEDIEKTYIETLGKVADILSPNLKEFAINIINEKVYNNIKKAVQTNNIFEILAAISVIHTGKFIKNDMADKIKDMILKFINSYIDSQKELSYNDNSRINSIFTTLSSIIADKDIDKTNVVDFYKRLFENNLINITNHAYNIAKLGKQGTPLLPYLKKAKEGIEESLKNRKQVIPYSNKEYQIKCYNYAIDSIEKGKLSEKYNIYR